MPSEIPNHACCLCARKMYGNIRETLNEDEKELEHYTVVAYPVKGHPNPRRNPSHYSNVDQRRKAPSMNSSITCMRLGSNS